MHVLNSMRVLGGVAFAVALGLASSVQAGTTLCPSTTDGNRQGSLTTDPGTSTCLDYGFGNIGQGNALLDDFLNGNGELAMGAGWTHLSGDDTNLGLPKTVSGIDWTGYARLALGFKVGAGTYCKLNDGATPPAVCTGNPSNRNGTLAPGFDWFVFELPTGETEAIFDVINNATGGGGLSHWDLYGIRGNTDVPAPGVLGLLGLSLVGLGTMRRRKTV